MRILLTGATGFVGAEVMRQLIDSRHEVGVIVRKDSDSWRISSLLQKATVIRGDIAEVNVLRPGVKAFKPECVTHLAWHGVGNDKRNDGEQFENVGQTIELLKLARDAGAKQWVGLGSQAEYGPCQGVADEQTPTRPTTLYGISKLSASLYAQHLCAEFGMRFAWLRLFSSYGPRDNPGWMIPGLIRSLLRRERPALTKGEQKWDYVYVSDAAAAICRVTESPKAQAIFNLGSGEANPLRSVVEQVRDLIDPSLPLGFGEVPYRPDQVMHLQADITRLRAIGWQPQVSLADGLKKTVEWYCERARATAN